MKKRANKKMKPLLEESVARNFAKLAGTEKHTESFLREMYEGEEEEPVEDELPPMDDDMPEEEGAMDTDGPAVDDMPGDDVPMDTEVDDDSSLTLTDEEAQALLSLLQKVQAAVGGDMSEPPETVDVPDMGEMDDVTGDVEEMPEEEMPEEEMPEEEMPEEEMPEEEVVNEVYRRVLRSLGEKKVSKSTLRQLAESTYRRLKK